MAGGKKQSKYAQGKNPNSLAALKKFGSPGGPDPSEAGKKGGPASAESRRKKRTMAECAAAILEMPRLKREIDVVETLEELGDIKNKNLTVQDMALLSVAKRAAKGDIEAIKLLRDTSGQKPVERVEMSTDSEKASAEIGKELEQLDGELNGE